MIVTKIRIKLIGLIVVLYTLIHTGCLKYNGENDTYVNLIGSWQERYVIDAFGNYRPGSYDIIVLDADFRAQRLCTINPSCIQDLDGKWFLSENSQKLIVLTYTGTIIANILDLDYDTLIIKSTNSSNSYLYTKIYW